MFKRSNIKRVLAIALSITISLTNTLSIRACTIDDLREMLGGIRSTEEEYLQKINVIISSYNMIENHNELVSIINSFGYKIDIGSSLNDMKNKVQTQEKEFNQLVKNGGDIKEIKGVLNELEKSKEIYVDLVESKEKIGKIKYKKNEYEDAYRHVMLLLNNIDDKTDIGGIGNNISMPTKTAMNIVSMFGEKVNKKEQKKIKVTSGKYGTDAVSMFNGKITSITEDKNKSYTIKIKVTPLLYLIYDNLDGYTVTKGQYITNGSIIGYALKSKPIGIKVVLDEKPINPLLMMGKQGWSLYSTWIEHNKNKNLSSKSKEDDFYINDFKSNYIETEEDDRNIVDGKVEVENEGSSKLKFDENYSVPDASKVE